MVHRASSVTQLHSDPQIPPLEVEHKVTCTGRLNVLTCVKMSVTVSLPCAFPYLPRHLMGLVWVQELW